MLVAPENGRIRSRNDILSNPERKFADAIAQGRSKEDALAEAGYSSKCGKSQAWKLLSRKRVIDRIAETNIEIARQVAVYSARSLSEIPNLPEVALTRTRIVSFFVVVAQEARKKQQFGAAVQAMLQAAKVSGAYVERTEQSVEFELLEKAAAGNLSELSDAQVERFMRAFETLAWGADKARIEAERRKQGLIEATAEVIENKE